MMFRYAFFSGGKRASLLFFMLSALWTSAFAAAPQNDDLAAALVVTGPNGTIMGTTVDASRQLNENSHDFAPDIGYRSVWFTWTATETKPVVFEIVSSGFDPVMAAYTGNAFPLTTISRNNDTVGQLPRLEFGAFAGVTYRIAIAVSKGPTAQGGTFEMQWQTANNPTNDNFANARELNSTQSGRVSLARLNATREIGEPLHIAGQRSTWFKFTNNEAYDISYTFTTSASDNSDSVIAVYEGSSLATLTRIVSNDNYAATSNARVIFRARSGVTYRIAVDEGPASNTGNSYLSWDITRTRPYTGFGIRDESSREVLDIDAADISVFRPSNGVWYWLDAGTNTFGAAQFGAAGDMPVPGDFDGDGRSDRAVVRNVNGSYIWWLNHSFDNSVIAIQWGINGDKPVVGDYDFDGRADIGVFRPSSGTWYILRSSDGQLLAKQFGTNGDIPVIGDFPGTTDATDIAVFRPSNGTWYLDKGNSVSAIQFGLSGDKPVVGDYDGDRKSDIAVFRPSSGMWFGLLSRTNGFFATKWGISGDIPLPADYDNNSNEPFDLCVFRPSDRTWYILRTEGTVTQFRQFGLSDDIPVASLSTLAQ